MGLGSLALQAGLSPTVAKAAPGVGGWDLATLKKAIVAENYVGGIDPVPGSGGNIASVDYSTSAGLQHALVFGTSPGVNNSASRLFVRFQPDQRLAFTPDTTFSTDTPEAHQAGSRVAVGDVDGDGTPDIFTGPASGQTSALASLSLNFTKITYNYPQQRGIYIAAGDLDGDGRADVVVSPSAADPNLAPDTGAVTINVYGTTPGGSSAPAGKVTFNPFSITRKADTGGPVALGKVLGTTNSQLVYAPTGLNPTVSVFNYSSGANGATSGFTGVTSFTASSDGSPLGVSLAVGDIDGDGYADIITGAGAGGGPHVKIYEYDPTSSSFSLAADYLAYDASYTGGVSVSVSDIDADGRVEILTSALSPVPEPGSIAAVVGIGMALLGRRRR